jgi:penicillin-binding protein 2
LAIGQGFNLTTPLQMATLIAAVANDGKFYKPIILDAIKSIDGSIVYQEMPQVVGKLPVSEDTLNIVKEGLWLAVNGEKGTARRIKMKHIQISGKTGTSQVVSRRDDEQEEEENTGAHLKAHAWFVAYAPSDDPRIAVSVIVEHGEHGSGAAAPIAREIIKTFLNGKWPERQMVKGQELVAEEESG